MWDVIFGGFLGFSPALIVIIFAIIVLVIINIFYKVLIDQEEAKRIKQRSRELSKQIREKQKAGESTKETMVEMMKENNRLMKMQFKPLIISLLIAALILPGMNTLYGDVKVPLNNQTGNFTMVMNNGAVSNIIAGEFPERGQVFTFTKVDNKLMINDIECQLTCIKEINSANWKISQEGESIKFARIIVFIPVSIPFWSNTFGWLGWYIILSIPLAIIIRKMMKINL